MTATRSSERTGALTTLGLVLAREIRTRTFSRTALMSIGFSVLIIAGLIFVPKIIGGGGADHPEVAVAGAKPAQVEQYAKLLPDNDVRAAPAGATPTEDRPLVVTLKPRAIDGKVYESSQLSELESVTARLQLALLSDGSGEKAPAVQLKAVHDDSEDVSRSMIGYLVVVLLFGQIVGMSSAVTQAMMEEKGNRVVDLLLPKIKPLSLLWGKVIGAGVAGLVQTGAMAGAALGLLLASGDRSTFDIVLGIGWIVLLWYLLGFLFMGVIYGGIGAMMRKPDDVPSVTVPLQLINMLTFLVGVVALQQPGAAWVDVVSKIPPFSAILVPLQYITQETTTGDMLTSAGIIVACALVLSLAGARLFSLAVRTDSPKDALRAFVTP
ncbi:ABC transporter permease [Streptomyces sp. NPDC048172]|uniref:ABC transporter permease n=1 Tax=Streptomyces sp. NPDC048172 TaxID=3365505 RepID=UPI0037107B81